MITVPVTQRVDVRLEGGVALFDLPQDDELLVVRSKGDFQTRPRDAKAPIHAIKGLKVVRSVQAYSHSGQAIFVQLGNGCPRDEAIAQILKELGYEP